jgi:hypothetical protein
MTRTGLSRNSFIEVRAMQFASPPTKAFRLWSTAFRRVHGLAVQRTDWRLRASMLPSKARWNITVPMSDVAKVINDRLVRVTLDEKERILAATLAKQMVIDDHFDYARIGLRRAELALPWN